MSREEVWREPADLLRLTIKIRNKSAIYWSIEETDLDASRQAMRVLQFTGFYLIQFEDLAFIFSSFVYEGLNLMIL